MTLHDASGTDNANPVEDGDADLIERSRTGDTDAFGELWRRHYSSGLVVARSLTSSIDPDDLVQEAYARIFDALRRGGGPSGSFRAYLFTSIRHTAAGWGRARRETAIDELDSVVDPASTGEAADDALDRSLSHRAFRSLPTRWQEVLWYTEIEQMKPADVAPLLGMRPTAVAQLAFRAREGLREAWIQAHLQSLADGSDCQWTVERLGAYARNNLGKRDRARLEEHLAGCARCTIVASEAEHVSRRLALVLLPLTVGVSASAAYLAAIQSGGAPVAAAAAAMPSGVVTGAVTAGGTPLAAVGTAGAAAGAVGAGTMTALVGAGALIAATVVAAVVVPSVLANSTPKTSVVAEQRTTGESPTAAQPTPLPSPSDVPTPSPTTGSVDVAPTQPVAAPRTSTPERTAQPVTPSTGATTPSTPSLPTTPTAPPTKPTTPPTDPTDPTDPPTDPTDPTDPPTDPTDPPTDPTTPTGAPTVGAPLISIVDGVLTITLPVSGVPDAAVDATLGGQDVTTVTLDSSGAGTIVLRPTVADVFADALIQLSYPAAVDGSAPTSLHLSDLLDLLGLAGSLSPVPTPSPAPAGSP